MADKYAWKNFGYAVERAERSLKTFEYRGVFETPLRSWSQFDDPPGLTLAQVAWILSAEALAPPHGLDVLTPPIPPELPELPIMPDSRLLPSYDKWTISRYEKLATEIKSARESVEAKMRQEQAECNDLAARCEAGDASAIRRLMVTTLRRHPLPVKLTLDADFALDKTSRVALCTIEVPDPAGLSLLRGKRGSSWRANWLGISAAVKKRASHTILRALCIRSAYLVAMGDPDNFFDTVAVNAHQKWFDPATGVPREGVVASLQAMKQELCQLQPGHLDPDACFRHLAGIATPNVLQAAPIRPIFVMNTEDKRIVANRDVTTQLQEEANLAAMPWDDFEHLVRQLFEWMFTSEGVEVKVTRASRDRGVDAIIFDPDPLRGGKYVVQAKRYTRTVDVAAVRDRYGTVMNEGANRGILVMTSSYGPDAYEFAKDKPISLIDGPNLIVLLRKHGRAYRIDLEEARRLDAE